MCSRSRSWRGETPRNWAARPPVGARLGERLPLAPLSQWRGVDRDDLEAIEEVLAEAFLAHVHLDLVVPRDAADPPVRQRPSRAGGPEKGNRPGVAPGPV